MHVCVYTQENERVLGVCCKAHPVYNRTFVKFTATLYDELMEIYIKYTLLRFK